MEMRDRLTPLAESVSEYLSSTMAILKNKKASDLFTTDGKPPLVDLELLGSIIASLKILGNKEYRQAMTKDDIGINPASMHEIFGLLDSVPRNGKNVPKDTLDTFKAINSIAPSLFKNEIQKLSALTSEGPDKEAVLRELGSFISKEHQLFNRLKSTSSQERQVDQAASAIA